MESKNERIEQATSPFSKGGWGDLNVKKQPKMSKTIDKNC